MQFCDRLSQFYHGGHILTLMRKFGEDDNAILYYAQEELKKVVA